MSEMRSENHAFVLRLWKGAESTDWRGRVQHAASGQIQYFQDMADMICFVETFMGPLPDSNGLAESKLK